jgi:hypothetical protein
MIISKAKLREMIDRELEEERRRSYVDNRLADLNRELYSEVGRLETMIRHVEARVMAHVEENKHAKTD